MASTTTNLGLTKPAYSDDADISDINGNMDLIDAEAGKVRANVAANYDSSETYAVGDYCLHDGSLYKCSTAISSPEAWTAGHWTQIKIAGELSTLNGKIANSPVSYTPSTQSNYNVTSLIINRVADFLIIVFDIDVTTATTSNVDYTTLPTGYRPSVNVTNSISAINNASATPLVFQVRSNGTVRLRYGETGGSYSGSVIVPIG